MKMGKASWQDVEEAVAGFAAIQNGGIRLVGLTRENVLARIKDHNANPLFAHDPIPVRSIIQVAVIPMGLRSKVMARVTSADTRHRTRSFHL
jgi:hypothetical protein